MDKDLKILTAQLRLRNGESTEPALYMKGDRHWLLTFIAMLFETMKQDGNLSDEEASRLLHAECFHLDMYRYRESSGTTIIDGVTE